MLFANYNNLQLAVPWLPGQPTIKFDAHPDFSHLIACKLQNSIFECQQITFSGVD